MADDIVQTIKIEVEGADQAADEIKKVGQATEEVQQTAASTGAGTQELGKGLDQVSQKSGVSTRQMRALGKVMKEFGAGELAGTAVGFVKIASALGPLGVALFVAAEAFAFIKGKMKEAEEASKALANTFANMAKTSAEMKAENDAAFWGTTAAEMKKVANEAGNVANQYKNIEAGRQKAISADVSAEARQKGLIGLLRQAGVEIDDVNASTDKLGENANKALMVFAKLADKMSPIGKAELAKDMKGLGFTDEQIKSIDKGSEKLKQLQDQAAKPFFSPEQQKSIDNLGTGWDKFVTASKRAWAMVAGDAETGGSGLAQRIGAAFATGFADMMVIFGQLLHGQIPQAWSSMFASIGEIASAKLSEIKAAITTFVTTAPGGAWQWISDTAASVWESVKTGAAQAYQSVVSFVTTPVGNAWQWIVDKWNAMLQALGFGGGAAAAPAGATGGSFAGGGLLGGRGTGTSDSNLAWVSRGEHIMPARAVAQPGVLAFLEALRFSGGNLRDVLDGMGRFALGGMIRAPLSLPAFVGGGAMNHVTIQFPGLPEITGLRASSTVVDELRKAAAMAQVRSGGRKPSRYS